ncbi:acyl-CoA dehydrogenase family protein [Natranaerofaba carboxydovora]|uniref:acyl-CoA dehydrogenase family protein n=1 Tax=Natranaerofaba carboxydovora TaxID=2742683 RepID=UPI001F149462|nr:acyl-CoA dehydrogenase family protein [Natranaerofaba carboxydovora]UMZ73278.1 putative acyl-CoA dehydrogenase [Natranaerofaba carboxydovora]
MAKKELIKGGAYLIEKIDPEQVFTPEDFTDEQKMIYKMAKDFAEGEVAPKIEELEKQEEGLAKSLVQKAGELGLVGADVPEAYEGTETDKVSSFLIAEVFSKGGSFALTYGAHTGIGTLPIIYFGNEDQKKRYLPALASGEKMAAYALTEPGAGSDAMNIKTKAQLSDDGNHYILNGSKQWITNGGWADVYVVFAKVDGEKFSAFIVERDWEGVSTGEEEEKMGIKGSSTRTINFDDVKVPKENLLFHEGKGHIVAFNVLNIGRFKLGVGCLGSAKEALRESVNYSMEREQFKTPICKFPMIMEKIAKMTSRIYASESMLYRIAGDIEANLENVDKNAEDAGKEISKAIEEYAIECSIAKTDASEMLDFVVDEGVQVHGGYGFSSEYPIERMYRDSRINKIFEGTNEVNRMIIPATIMRKAQKGELPLMGAAQKLRKELALPMEAPESNEFPYPEIKLLENAKKICMMVSGAAVEKFGEKLRDQQEILSRIANLMIEVYMIESSLLRAIKSGKKDKEKGQLMAGMTQLYINDKWPLFIANAKEALKATEEGDNLATMLAALKKYSYYEEENIVKLQRGIAKGVYEAKGYPFSYQ